MPVMRNLCSKLVSRGKILDGHRERNTGCRTKCSRRAHDVG